MSKPIQNLESIGPMKKDEGQEEHKSQAQLDYEEGRGYVERGEASLAAVSLHNALRGFEEEGNREGIANASNQLGHACLQRQEFEKALSHYKRAWEICEDLQDKMSLLALSFQLIEAHKGLKNYRQALDICLDLLDAYQLNNDPQGSVVTLEKMADIYLETKAPDKAADAYRTIASIHENFKHEKIAESFRQKAAELTGGN